MISGCVLVQLFVEVLMYDQWLCLVQLFVEGSMYDQWLCFSTTVCGSLDV